MMSIICFSQNRRYVSAVSYLSRSSLGTSLTQCRVGQCNGQWTPRHWDKQIGQAGVPPGPAGGGLKEIHHLAGWIIERCTIFRIDMAEGAKVISFEGLSRCWRRQSETSNVWRRTACTWRRCDVLSLSQSIFSPLVASWRKTTHCDASCTSVTAYYWQSNWVSVTKAFILAGWCTSCHKFLRTNNSLWLIHFYIPTFLIGQVGKQVDQGKFNPLGIQ